MVDSLRIALAQISPVWMQREATINKIGNFIDQAGEQDCKLVVFGECLCPGYPFWVELSGGASFNSSMQKSMYAHYADQAVQIEAGHLDFLCTRAASNACAVIVGVLERPKRPTGHSVYCSLVYIDDKGNIKSVHRKLMPTYEERLVWAQGDGAGLVTHPIEKFTLGALNCWENWMPLPRATLYAQGEDLHIALWPGNLRNTEHITRFIALESRSYVVSVSALMARSHIPDDLPISQEMLKNAPEWMADGGSCVAAPDGSWLLEPIRYQEGLSLVTLDHARVREERQNFDPAGHYSRPDITQLTVNRERLSTVKPESVSSG